MAPLLSSPSCHSRLGAQRPVGSRARTFAATGAVPRAKPGGSAVPGQSFGPSKRQVAQGWGRQPAGRKLH
eukprot:868480-Alexandrium_andersonii.AAC.1